MRLQKLIHNKLDMEELDEDTIIVHGVNEIELGGEYTICGRAIPDSYLETEGFERVGPSFIGSIKKCECKDCIKTIRYFKSLR